MSGYEREEHERKVIEAATRGMNQAAGTLSAAEWRAKFERGLPRFLDRWEARYGADPFTIHDMYDTGLPAAPDGGDCAGPAILAAARKGLIKRIGDKKSTRTTQHRRVSAYVRGDT